MAGPLARESTLEAFARLDHRLVRSLKLMVAGDTAMCLAYGMPEGTQHVDGVTFQGFDKIEDIKDEILAVAQELQLPHDWINPYFGNFAFVLPKDYSQRLKPVFNGKHLEVFVLGAEDLLIMKLHAGRPKDDSHIRRLLKTQDADFSLVETHLQELVERHIPRSEEALELFDRYREEMGLDG